MRRYLWLTGAALLMTVACQRPVNIEHERNSLLERDREWSQSVKDADRFVSFFAEDGSISPPGMPAAAGEAAVRKFHTQMTSMPGFAVSWTPTKADVSAAGDLGYTAGTYEMHSSLMTAPEKGKYVSVWKKHADGRWMVVQDAFNADAGPAPGQHVMTTAAALSWGDAPPALPPGAKIAVIAGDPGKAAPYLVRLQFPAGYQIAAHWHPTDENVTVLSGTLAVGMGDKFDSALLQELPAGSAAVLPAEMRHFAMAKTAVTVQLHGMGPLVLNYVNPADDPSKKTGT